MIEMWDRVFSNLDPRISDALNSGQGDTAFDLMHAELDKVWSQVYNILEPGGIACINVGDATRKIDDSFKLYSNHSRILSYCARLGFHVLPEILWRKQSNKPTKFMGSGMLPPGAYVTQEHEYVLILRKGERRQFVTDREKSNRMKSAFFWEERNSWFSDVWEDLKGDRQALNQKGLRERSAAFPFDLAYRLVSMFSVMGDSVLDPFVGTGTTALAAMALGRNSNGYEISPEFKQPIESRIGEIVNVANDYNRNRIAKHLEFARNMRNRLSYANEVHGFPVMTSQEIMLEIPIVKSVKIVEQNTFEVDYLTEPLKVGQSLF
jgi:DNA modification methylase